MQADNVVEFASGFDMNHLMELQDQVILIKKLHTIYGLHYHHMMQGVEENGGKILPWK